MADLSLGHVLLFFCFLAVTVIVTLKGSLYFCTAGDKGETRMSKSTAQYYPPNFSVHRQLNGILESKICFLLNI